MAAELEFLNLLIEFRTPILTSVMLSITALGSLVFAVILGLSLFRFDRHLSERVLLSGVLSFMSAHLLKILFMRPRPPVETLVSASSYAFPSGHAAVSFGIATVLSRKTGLKFFYLIAGTVCFSRLYLGVHYPSDVISGALLGYLAAIVSESISERFYDSG